MPLNNDDRRGLAYSYGADPVESEPDLYSDESGGGPVGHTEENQ